MTFSKAQGDSWRVLIGCAATAPYSEPDWQEGAIAAAWQALTSLQERAMRG